MSSAIIRWAFVIVDPSLRYFVGHHDAYDSAVAAAAADAGFAPGALAHHAAIPAVAEGLGLVPCFRRDN